MFGEPSPLRGRGESIGVCEARHRKSWGYRFVVFGELAESMKCFQRISKRILLEVGDPIPIKRGRIIV
jgi:hypothetical protein